MDEIAAVYEEIVKRQDFQDELAAVADYGRPSPSFHARRLSDQLGGAQIHLKREDLESHGAHKINHCLGEALLAKFMGKKSHCRETGAASMAWPLACALVGIPWARFHHTGGYREGAPQRHQDAHPGLVNLVPVTRGAATLKGSGQRLRGLSAGPRQHHLRDCLAVGPPLPMMRCGTSSPSSVVRHANSSQTRHGKAARPCGRLPAWRGSSNAMASSRPFWVTSPRASGGREPAGEA